MLKILKFQDKNKKDLIKLMAGLQDYLVSIDTFEKLKRDKNYGKKYVKYLLKIIKEDKGIILLAEFDNKIIGCVAGIIETLDKGEVLGNKKKLKTARILELYVESEYRGKHIAVKLMTEITKHFKTKKCEQLRLEVYAPNSNAHNFYLSQGFKNESIDLMKKI
ncbi:MAG: GNAT family N-acetyltransferase [Candidatus Magasanikbacteria bacterium]